MRRQLVEPGPPPLAVRRQCALLGLSRAALYDAPRPESAVNLRFMRLLDEPYTRTPYDGIRRMTAWLRTQGYHINGCIYVVAILDGFSRDVLAWEVSVTLDRDCCINALERALVHAQPEMFNAAPGGQFTSRALTERLKARGIQISMDGRGRALDNIFVERRWRTLKYEAVSRHDDRSVPEAIRGLGRYCSFYNRERLHQALNDHTPEAVDRQLARARESRFPP
jgi:transposase InsO family protein